MLEPYLLKQTSGAFSFVKNKICKALSKQVAQKVKPARRQQDQQDQQDC